ncbi:osteopontin isoform X2 [Etheostoma cragini]|uniref:osteopontin isoform X2 n=1 Tax=Etheostoma cragini TaxID=417921 RepID=UPI00155EF953|nr:osteopontin isoform X2 [Etheostoma cragini]
MKVAVIFVLLFATVLCRPARKVSVSSSESSEEAVRRPAAPALRKQALDRPQNRAAPVQSIVAEAAAAAASSDESPDGSDEEEQAAAKAFMEITSDNTDTTSSPDTATVNDEDDDDDDDDDDDTEESESNNDESSDSSESGESSTPATATDTPVVVTEEPVAATTPEPIVPSIVTDTDAGRGDSLGGYPSDYKSIVYVEDKSYQKVPSPYKSYEFVGTGKKMAYDMTEGNEVEKSLTVYKALQVHSDLLEEDTSTPEVESQGLDASSGTSQDQKLSPRQAALPEEEESASTTESSSTPEEDESASNSASASQESEDEDSQSSEEATATPGAADSESDESAGSDSDEEGAGPDTTTDMPVVITAK